MVLILFTLQTSKVSASSLPAQNYLSIIYNREMRIWFYYYPADTLPVWKFSAARNETHKKLYLLKIYTTTTEEDEDEIGGKIRIKKKK